MSLVLTSAMSSAGSLNKAADRASSAIKHLSLKLKANWSNLDAWLVKQRTHANGLDLIDAFTVKCTKTDGIAVLTNTLMEDEHLEPISKWSKTEAKNACPHSEEKDEEHKAAHQRVKNVGNVLLLNSVDDDVTTAFPTEEHCADCAVSIACIKLAANPADDINDDAPCDRIHGASIKPCGGLTALNFQKLAKALRKAQQTLNDRGERASDDQLRHALCKAMPNAGCENTETTKKIGRAHV